MKEVRIDYTDGSCLIVRPTYITLSSDLTLNQANLVFKRIKEQFPNPCEETFPEILEYLFFNI